MQTAFRRFFTPPVFPEDQEATASAAILHISGWAIILVLTAVFAMRNISARPFILHNPDLILLAIIFIALLAIFMARRGYVRAASFMMITAGWIGISGLAWASEGIRDAAFFAYSIPIFMAGLLLGWQGALIFTLGSIISGWALALVETNGLLIPNLDAPLGFARDMTALFLLIGLLVSLTITRLRSALRTSRVLTQDLSVSNQELKDLQISLEQRVEERTAALQKRASQMEAVSSVARAIASIQNLEDLLPTIAKLISQQFRFYHVGIFLLNEQQDRAILQASNSEGGLQMVKQHHSLPIDLHSIVGYSVSRGEPYIVSDVRLDAIYFTNPNLPETRSEMALPLRFADKVIGALDVQSIEINAFSQEDIGVLAILADQVAIAIENARLFDEAKKALNESKALFARYSQQEWSNFARQAKQAGFVFDGKQVLPLEKGTQREPGQTTIQTGSLSPEKASASIAIPIRLRGQTIGILDVRSKKGQREWKQDEITLLEAAAERTALALETARLVESAQRRAARERAIGDISARIGAVSNLESILQTAVEELGRKIGGATEVTLEITTDNGHR